MFNVTPIASTFTITLTTSINTLQKLYNTCTPFVHDVCCIIFNVTPTIVFAATPTSPLPSPLPSPPHPSPLLPSPLLVSPSQQKKTGNQRKKSPPCKKSKIKTESSKKTKQR